MRSAANGRLSSAAIGAATGEMHAPGRGDVLADIEAFAESTFEADGDGDCAWIIESTAVARLSARGVGVLTARKGPDYSRLGGATMMIGI